MGAKSWTPHPMVGNGPYCQRCQLPPGNERHAVPPPYVKLPGRTELEVVEEPLPPMVQQVVVLHIAYEGTREDGLPVKEAAQWDWPTLLDEPYVTVIASGPVLNLTEG